MSNSYSKEKRRQQMIELQRQMQEAEKEQQALAAAAASKQHNDLMDKIRTVWSEINFINDISQQLFAYCLIYYLCNFFLFCDNRQGRDFIEKYREN